jgi:phenylalanyl-tRNA synthetase alpha chain
LTKDSLSITEEMNLLLTTVNSSGNKTLNELADILQFPRAKVELLMFQLLRDELVSRQMDIITRAELTEEGKRIQKEGLPENQLLTFLHTKKTIPLGSIANETKLSKQAVNAAIGQLRKNAVITIDKGTVSLVKLTKKVNSEVEKAIAALVKNPSHKVNAKILSQLTRRKLIELKERQQTYVKISQKGIDALPKIKIINTVSKLSPEHIRSGDWRSLQLKQYKIATQPKNIPVGRKHPYLIFLQEVKQKLLGLGFSEMRGPLVETEFWNFDALFQAQDHPAREWSDVYTIKAPSYGNLPEDKKLINAVKKAHETGEPVGSRGWRYKWDSKKASRLLLRPQGTSISARTLYNLKIPAKYFSIARCYRPDSVDATHLSEFNQMEGIVCDLSITFRDLLGVLKSFAIEVAGASEVKFRPDYYPFTSPSVELSALHPELGYIEFGGAGIFRPELTAPFGIKDPVVAWGIGIDRLYMVNQGISDIRELFTQKLEWLRTVPRI